MAVVARAAEPEVIGLQQQGLPAQAAVSAALEALVQAAVLVESAAVVLAESELILSAAEETLAHLGQAPAPVVVLPSVAPAVARIQAEVTRAAGVPVQDASRRLRVERFEHFVSVL